MSGGRIAIKGFDYQATVILDQLFDHFELHEANARVRPEGVDDLDLIWTEDGRERHRYLQVKKPRETLDGALKAQCWTLVQIADELLPNTLAHLDGNDARQVWILGDAVVPEMHRLIAAGVDARSSESAYYWALLHLLARSAIDGQLPVPRAPLLRWRFRHSSSATADGIRAKLQNDYGSSLEHAGASSDVVRRYREQVVWLDQRLPDVLARTEISDNYGSEEIIADRFRQHLVSRYRLPASVVEHTLFRNLRAYVNDIAKVDGKTFGPIEFNYQLRSAWPQMSVATEPPVLRAGDVWRSDLVGMLVTADGAVAVEAIGISGSGKTTLAAQAAHELLERDPQSIPIYIRVRQDATFRDAMASAAFYLFQKGIGELFALTVESQPADDTVIARFAQLCAGLSQPIFLLLDLVEGRCNDEFANDLGLFLRVLEPGSCRLAIFGQRSSLRGLSPVAIASSGVRRINIRGFSFTEFLRLVRRRHHDADRDALASIYTHITAGRETGMHAQIAEALTCLQSVAAMERLSSSYAPEDMLVMAEQSRFAQLAPALRSAAESLVCFALPFDRHDAERAFPDENVGAAIQALADLSLLRALPGGLMEIHESVRAGLEAGFSLAARQKAHTALAGWAQQQGDIAAEILHLEKAGQCGNAKALGRDTFLRGDAWRSLSNYVVNRGLVTADEVIDVVAHDKEVSDLYWLGSVLKALPSHDGATALMTVLQQQPARYFRDYRWGHEICKAILILRPTNIQALLSFTIAHAPDAWRRRGAITGLASFMRQYPKCRSGVTEAFVREQSEDVQRDIVPLLFIVGRRAELRLAFDILARPIADHRDRHDTGLDLASFVLDQRSDVVEFLAALPVVENRELLLTRSVCLNFSGNVFWKTRDSLCLFCAEILRAAHDEGPVKINALRVLIYFGYPELEQLVDPLGSDPDLEPYFLLGPALKPEAYDVSRYEHVLLDITEPLPRRMSSLGVLVMLGADVARLRQKLHALPSEAAASFWDEMLLWVFVEQPFEAGIAKLQTALALRGHQPMWFALWEACLTKAAERSWPSVTDLLIEGARHPNQRVRESAVMGLARRRSRAALEPLMQQLSLETERKTAVLIATAIAASGPKEADALKGPISQDIQLWQCIIAMRTRDATFAPRLITIAQNTALHWRLRRAAIHAAARLPFDAALAKIAPLVLAEKSSLTLDTSYDLHAHAMVSNLLHANIPLLVGGGETAFIDTVVHVLERNWDLNEIPAAEVGRWLYQSLKNSDVYSHVSNTLYIPLLQAAVLRGFRLCERPDEIEAVLAQSQSLWLSVRCLQERRRVSDVDPIMVGRLRQMVADSPVRNNPMLVQLVDQMEQARKNPRVEVVPKKFAAVAKQTTARILDYETALRALRGTEEIGEKDPIIALAPLDQSQVRRLIVLVDPVNEPDRGGGRFERSVSFTPRGHTVGHRSSSYNRTPTVHYRLRPAVAAANRYREPMPWHEERMREPWVIQYAPQFLACLGAQGDSERFYSALEDAESILLPCLGRYRESVPESLLDDRLAPILSRHLSQGDDTYFEALCMLTRHVQSAAAIPLLSRLLQRWKGCFEAALLGESDKRTAMWRGFARLKEHPLFKEVPAWRQTLEEVLQKHVAWYNKRDILRILEEDPCSYIIIERCLLQEEDWSHPHRPEIDHLDAAADQLFSMTID